MTWPKDTTPAVRKQHHTDTTVSYTTTLSVCFFHRYYLSVFENSLSCRLMFQMQLCSKYKDAGNVMQVVGINRQSCRLRNRPIKKGGERKPSLFFYPPLGGKKARPALLWLQAALG